jgi:transcriptional regulator with XRE-family HTH domain
VNLFRFRLKELREENNISRSDLAEILGVSTQTIANYENGHREPNFDILLKIADYFNVTVDYLIGRSNYRTVEEQITKRNKFERFVIENLPSAVWDEKIEKEVGTFIEEILEPLMNSAAVIFYYALLESSDTKLWQVTLKEIFLLLYNYWSNVEKLLQNNTFRHILFYHEDFIYGEMDEIFKHFDNLENLTSVYEKYNNEIEKMEKCVDELKSLIPKLVDKFTDLINLFYAGIQLSKFPRFDYLFEKYGEDFVINLFRTIKLKQHNKEGDSDGSKDT